MSIMADSLLSAIQSRADASSGGSDCYDKYIQSLRIEGQVAVADLVVNKAQNNKNKSIEIQARLDFTGVPDSQVLLWAANTKMIDLKEALSGCTINFINNLVKQGPVCCPVLEIESMFDDPATKKDQSVFICARQNKLVKLYDIATEYFCSLHIEEQVAVVDFVVCKNDNSDEDLIFQVLLDFTGVPDTQVLLWAARTKMMVLHSALSNCDKALLKDLAKLGVCRHVLSAGTPFDDFAKNQNRAMAVVQDMSAEERAELIRRLQEMDK